MKAVVPPSVSSPATKGPRSAGTKSVSGRNRGFRRMQGQQVVDQIARNARAARRIVRGAHAGAQLLDAPACAAEARQPSQERRALARDARRQQSANRRP